MKTPDVLSFGGTTLYPGLHIEKSFSHVTRSCDSKDDNHRILGVLSMVGKLPSGSGEYADGPAVSALYDVYPVITEGLMFGEPMVTVCTAYNGIDFGRGVAVRSVDDEWDQHKAFFVARCYAVRALKGRPDKFITDKRAISVLAKTMCPWVKHSDGNPMVTWRERKILLSRGDFAKTVDKAGLGFSERFRVKTGKTGISFRVNGQSFEDYLRKTMGKAPWATGGIVGGGALRSKI
jgi:hypothetical protein